MRRSIIHPLSALGALAVFMAACDNDPTPGPVLDSGSLEVRTVTTGDQQDTNGYVLVMADGAAHSMGPTDAITIAALEPGVQEVQLTDVAGNCSVGGSNPRLVTVVADATAETTFGVACEAGIDPEGSGLIAFHSDRDGVFDIYLLDLDGDLPATRLTTAGGAGPALSPDGTRVAFMSHRDGNSEIYVMNVDGTGQTNLTGHGAADERPSWSPDGARILFSSDREGPAGNVEIFVMNADGSDVIRLTDDPSIDRPAHWSPDGSRIAFSSNRGGAFDIWVMNADGTGPVTLTDTPAAADFAPAWSPDGTRIAFTRNTAAPSERGDIWVIEADGSNPVNLTNSADVDNRWPSWSPDGAQVLFTSRRTGNTEVFVMRADGSNVVNVSVAPDAIDVGGWPQGWGVRSEP